MADRLRPFMVYMGILNAPATELHCQTFSPPSYFDPVVQGSSDSTSSQRCPHAGLVVSVLLKTLLATLCVSRHCSPGVLAPFTQDTESMCRKVVQSAPVAFRPKHAAAT